jgi:hypothetical protein
VGLLSSQHAVGCEEASDEAQAKLASCFRVYSELKHQLGPKLRPSGSCPVPMVPPARKLLLGKGTFGEMVVAFAERGPQGCTEKPAPPGHGP